MSDQKDRKVVFRRIHGRIVPIAVGTGALVASKAITSRKVDVLTRKKLQKYAYNVALGGRRNRKVVDSTLGLPFPGSAPVKINKRYNKLLTKVSDKLGRSDGKHTLLFNPIKPDAQKGSMFQSRFFSHFKRSAGGGTIEMNIRHPSIALHEMAHKIQYEGKSLFRGKKWEKLVDFSVDNLTRRFNLERKPFPPWKDYNYVRNPKLQKRIDDLKYIVKNRSEILARKFIAKPVDAILDAIGVGAIGYELLRKPKK